MPFSVLHLPRLCSLLVLSAISAVGAHASTVGINTGSFGGTVLDGCPHCSYVLPTAFSGAGVMTTYTIHAGGTGDITPLLLNGTDNGNGTTTFTITGVGGRQNDTNVVGIQTFNFGLQSGSAAVTATTYFGWFDSNASLVTYTYTVSGAGTFLFDGNDSVG